MTSRYELDFDVGGERLAGEVTVELTGLKIDLALVVASYVFQLDEGDMPLVGQIFYKADAYRSSSR